MQNIADQIRERLGSDQPLVFVSGNFNILHPGHLRLLRFAAEAGGALVVGVNSDDTIGVTMPQVDRLQGVQAISAVVEAVALTEPPERFVARLKPEIVIKGKEYADRFNAEQGIVDSYGGRLMFSSGEVRFASKLLLEREYSETQFSVIRKPTDYPTRNGFRIADLERIPPQFANLNVVVVGDLIVDEYISCDPIGMSQEDPTIVVTPIESRLFVGGAGIVAAHARGLGAKARYIAVSGEDASAKFARDELEANGVDISLFVDPARPTTLKQRYRASGKTLLRVNHLRQHAIEADQQSRIYDAVDAALGDADILLFADYNYGCLPQPLVDALAKRAKSRGVMMAADSQASSQISDISRFKDMALITPTEREARLALRDHEAGLVVLADRLQRAAEATNVVVTLGAEGLLIHAPDQGAYRTERLPAFNTVPKDVAGAGDSFFICTAMALRLGVDIWTAAYLGSLAAACQVSRVGNMPLSAAELMTEIGYPAP
ncbi:MAG: adenylyltransferase/cytidyltransferase family protein [Proteobacteria bacterium]|nr:adenylyltransferase/cytidyltransferase family protein [Pseudomonadota bacterium]